MILTFLINAIKAECKILLLSFFQITLLPVMASSSFIQPGSTCLAMAREKSIKFEDLGCLERVKEGINTIGGVATLDGEKVFVKVLDRKSAQQCAFADYALSLFGLPHVGMKACRIKMPPDGGEFPRFKFDGATLKKAGLVDAVISPFHDCGTINAFVCQKEGMMGNIRKNKDVVMIKVEEKPEEYKDMLLAWSRALILRMAFGVGDMGPGNFLYDSAADTVSCIDLSSCFSKAMDPREPSKKMLEANLLPDPIKHAMLAVGAEEHVASFVAGWSDLSTIRNLLMLELIHFDALKKDFGLVDSYIMPNLSSCLADFSRLLRSRSARGGGKRKQQADQDVDGLTTSSSKK